MLKIKYKTRFYGHGWMGFPVGFEISTYIYFFIYVPPILKDSITIGF